MDLTKEYPRSVRDTILGVVQLPRTVDKARAYAAGKVGEYHYNCSMDQGVFAFLGIKDHEAFAREASSRSDADLERWLDETYVSKKTPAEIAAWDAQWLEYGPDPGSDGEKYMKSEIAKIAPDRTDVRAWADFLDLDEHRPVPHRAGV
ncbi:MAG TPA: DUF5069 domain-containing protein [Candidatus Eremiobacteraceae bacterium]|nr:DUF5069 domain-containing protein [Candidatus Eremiobacteraceae bacterium]